MKKTIVDLLRLAIHMAILRPFCRVVFGVNVHGQRHIPQKSPFVIVSNHNSHLDALLTFLLVPKSHICRTHIVAAKAYFSKNRVLYWFVSFLFQPVWISKERGGSNTVETMGTVLDSGHNIIVFPEGTRGNPNEMGRFRSGVGRLLENRPTVPAIPVFMLGPERVLPRKTTCPLPIWNQVFVGRQQRCTGNGQVLTTRLAESIVALAASANAKRHQRLQPRNRAFTVAVLGIDGSGKSTVTQYLAEQLSKNRTACLVGDELQVFRDGENQNPRPLLAERARKAIAVRAKRAKSLQRYKLPKLAELLLRNRLQREAERWYRPDMVLMDGSPLINLTAWSNLYSENLIGDTLCSEALAVLSGRKLQTLNSPLFKRHPELLTMKRLRLTNLTLPDAVLFLDVAPSTSMTRIRSRGETVQVHETTEKLARLRRAYKMAVQVASRDFNVPFRIIDAENALDEVLDDSLGFINQLGVCHA